MTDTPCASCRAALCAELAALAAEKRAYALHIVRALPGSRGRSYAENNDRHAAGLAYAVTVLRGCDAPSGTG